MVHPKAQQPLHKASGLPHLRRGSTTDADSEPPEDPLNAAGEGGDIQISGRLGYAERSAAAQTRGPVLAAAELPPRLVHAVRRVLRPGP